MIVSFVCLFVCLFVCVCCCSPSTIDEQDVMGHDGHIYKGRASVRTRLPPLAKVSTHQALCIYSGPVSLSQSQHSVWSHDHSLLMPFVCCSLRARVANGNKQSHSPSSKLLCHEYRCVPQSKYAWTLVFNVCSLFLPCIIIMIILYVRTLVICTILEHTFSTPLP